MEELVGAHGPQPELVLLFVGCILIKVHTDSLELADPELARRLLGFSSVDEIVAVLIIFSFSVLFALLGVRR